MIMGGSACDLLASVGSWAGEM